LKLQDFSDEARSVLSLSDYGQSLLDHAAYQVPVKYASSEGGSGLESGFKNQTFACEADKVEFWRVRRKLRRHRERLGVLRGLGKFGNASAIFTFTVNDEVYHEPDVICRGCALVVGLPIRNPRALLAQRVNSRLTATGARLRRLGLNVWVTAKEYGKKTGRAHHHRVLDLGVMESGDDLVKYLVLTSARFRRFRREYVLTERDYIPIHSGRRSESEIVVARWFAAQWGLGYVDCHIVTGGAHACGYVLTYVGKAKKHGAGASVRVSYSRSVSEHWGYGSKILVYAHGGECVRYPLYPLAMRLRMEHDVDERYMWRGARLVMEWLQARKAWGRLKAVTRSELARRSQAEQWHEYDRVRYGRRTARQLSLDIRSQRERRAYAVGHYALLE
jgi:hypothetical protein